MPLNVADRFFYEELAQFVGHEASSQWLLSQNSVRSRHRSSLTSTGSSASPCRTPNRSMPASPPFHSSADLGDGCGNSRHLCPARDLANTSSVLPALDLSSQQPFEASTAEAILKNSSRLSASLAADSSKLGLIYTDAAHSVLD
jgi:hypothetical protein